MHTGGAFLLILIVVAAISLFVYDKRDLERWQRVQMKNRSLAKARADVLETAFHLIGEAGSYKATSPDGDQLEMITYKPTDFFLFKGSLLMELKLKLKSLQISGSSDTPPEYRYGFQLRKLAVRRAQTTVDNPHPVHPDGTATAQELAQIEMYLRNWQEFRGRARRR